MSDPIIKTYVWHGGKCFFVSTIERDSSAMLSVGRYNETMVWEYDWDKAERKDKILFQGEDHRGSIRNHNRVVERIFATGIAEEIDPDE